MSSGEGAEYRIVTYCPAGMSPELKALLGRPVRDDPSFLIRDLVGMKLTEPFKESDLPFAGTCIAWSKVGAEDLRMMEKVRRLESMRCWQAPQAVSLEVLEATRGTTRLSIAGIYPLLDKDEGGAARAYSAVSFIRNRLVTDHLLEWAWVSIIRGATQYDQAGMLLAIHGRVRKSQKRRSARQLRS